MTSTLFACDAFMFSHIQKCNFQVCTKLIYLCRNVNLRGVDELNLQLILKMNKRLDWVRISHVSFWL
jgi:hypothetical protein